MKCKNKEVKVTGIVNIAGVLNVRDLTCIITNDEKGKTLSIDNGSIQLSIPFEPIEKYLRGDYTK
jgi:hypothetical protein